MLSASWSADSFLLSVILIKQYLSLLGRYQMHWHALLLDRERVSPKFGNWSTIGRVDIIYSGRCELGLWTHGKKIVVPQVALYEMHESLELVPRYDYRVSEGSALASTAKQSHLNASSLNRPMI